MSSEHAHAIPVNQNEPSLWCVLGLTSSFFLAEVVAANRANTRRMAAISLNPGHCSLRHHAQL